MCRTNTEEVLWLVSQQTILNHIGIDEVATYLRRFSGFVVRSAVLVERNDAALWIKQPPLPFSQRSTCGTGGNFIAFSNGGSISPVTRKLLAF
jgi:hypothetical protein